MSTELTLEPKVEAALKLWHTMIETGDLSALPTIVAPDAQFRSPTDSSRTSPRMPLCSFSIR
ncbi:hypothetical protein ACETU7_15690 [Rhodococcus sp. 3Y1]